MNTLDITAIPALSDNYVWLVRHGQHALLIDPGEAQPVLDYLHAHHLSPTQIWVTHQHGDHIGGIAELRRHYPDCRVFGADNIALADETVRDSSPMHWQGFRAEAWHTAGHTAEHLCYLLHDGRRSHFFCGDTLFPQAAAAFSRTAAPNGCFKVSSASEHCRTTRCCILRMNTPPPTCVSRNTLSRTIPILPPQPKKQPAPPPCPFLWHTKNASTRFCAHTCPKSANALKPCAAAHCRATKPCSLPCAN